MCFQLTAVSTEQSYMMILIKVKIIKLFLKLTKLTFSDFQHMRYMKDLGKEMKQRAKERPPP